MPANGAFPLTRPGERLTPSHTVRKGTGTIRRHRYYVSHRLMAKGASETSGWRLPAADLEHCLAEAVRSHLQDQGLNLIACPQTVSENQSGILIKFANLSTCQSGKVLALIERVTVVQGALTIRLEPKAVAERLAIDRSMLREAALEYQIGWRTRRRGVETKIVSGTTEPKPDQTLIRAIARAHSWVSDIRNGISIADIAQAEQVTECRIREILPLGIMAPRLVEQILAGKQPASLTLEILRRQRLPVWFEAQAEMMGFSNAP